MQKRYPLLFQIDRFMRSSGSLAYSVATTTKTISSTSTPIQLTVTAGVTQVYYIHTDQLNTPRLITNSANAKVWEWNNDDPFANNPVNDDPNATGNHFTYNPRLPGQYFDSETNTNYNYFRDYDSESGRYIESDPIGLQGGINTYGYVGGNPLSGVDPRGLWELDSGAHDWAGHYPTDPNTGLPLHQPSGYEHCCDPREILNAPTTWVSCFKCGNAVSGVLSNCGCELYVPKGSCNQPKSGCE
jgi:RHS repeat-associated protein